MSRRLHIAVAAAVILAVVVPIVAHAGPTVDYRDEFKSISYAGNDGTVAFASPWTEVGTVDGPSSGVIQVVTSSMCASSSCLRIGDSTISQDAIHRLVGDLSSYTSATLTLTYRREKTSTGAGQIWLQITSDGSSWYTLETFKITDSDAGQLPLSFDITPWLSPSTEIFFNGSGNLSGFLYVDNIAVTVSSNNPPVFDATPPDRSDTESDSVSFAVSATDPDVDDLTYGATGLPPGTAIDPDTGVVSGSIGYSAASSSPFTTVVTVDDGYGGTDAVQFTWMVADLNRPPTLDPISDLTIGEGEPLDITAVADDPDLPDDNLTYSLTAAPAGAAISPAGRITWTTHEADGPGDYTFTVQVVDAAQPGATATESFVVSVDEVNAAPSVDSVAAQANGAGDTVSLVVNASDPDVPANTLSYSATGLPPGLTIGASSGVITGTIPASAPESSTAVVVTVSDNGQPAMSDSTSFTWSVTRSNRAPVLRAIAEQAPKNGGDVEFTASATDPDGDGLTYWLGGGAPPGASIDPGTGVFSWRPGESQMGDTYNIVVGVTDDGSPALSDQQNVRVVLPRLNRAPAINDPGDQRTAEGELVELALEADDPDLPDDSLRFSGVGLPAGLTINTSTGVISGVVDFEAAESAAYTVVVTVADSGDPALQDSVGFTWTITNTNRAPVAEPAAYEVLAGDTVEFVLVGKDPDGDELEVVIAGNPEVGQLALDGWDATYVAPGGFDGTTALVFTVSDGSLESSAEITIAVRTTNADPVAVPDVYELEANQTLVVDTPGVLANDSDPDGDLLIARLVSGPTHGVATLSSNGAFTYEAEAGFAGTDTFVYESVDPLGALTRAVITIEISEPVALPEREPEAEPENEMPRIDVVTSTRTSTRDPEPETAGSAEPTVVRTVVAALRAGFAVIPQTGFPLLLLGIALLLGLTIGRLSLTPVLGARSRGKGMLLRFDPDGGNGIISPDDGEDDVFVHARSVRRRRRLIAGQHVRFLAVTTRGRRVAITVHAARQRKS